MARTKLIYTYAKDNKYFIVDRKTFIKILSEEIYYDTTNCGWFGVDSANYEKGTRVANELARKRSALICCGTGYSFKVFTEEYFTRHTNAFGHNYTDLRGK